MCDPSTGYTWCDPIRPLEPCCGPFPYVGRIRHKLKAGYMWSTWDCYRHNGVQDQAPCRVRVGIPNRYWYLIPPGTPLQPCQGRSRCC